MADDRQVELLAAGLQRVGAGSLLRRVVVAAADLLAVESVTAALITADGGGCHGPGTGPLHG